MSPERRRTDRRTADRRKPAPLASERAAEPTETTARTITTGALCERLRNQLTKVLALAHHATYLNPSGEYTAHVLTDLQNELANAQKTNALLVAQNAVYATTD